MDSLNLIGAAGTVITLILLLVNAAIQIYGLKRDIIHLKRSFKQLSENIVFIDKDVDNHLDTMNQNLNYRFDSIDKALIEITLNLNMKR